MYIGANLNMDPSIAWNHKILISFTKVIILSHIILQTQLSPHEMYSHVLGATHIGLAIMKPMVVNSPNIVFVVLITMAL